VVPVVARPINRTSFGDVECCSFSARIPGVVDRLSKIFREDRLPGLLTIEVEDDEAIAATRKIIAKGFPVGPSSGLNFCAAIEAAKRIEGPIVTIFPDRMERYFTTELFSTYRS
ncbi:MAG: cysteine synthase family protein, partial [Acidobacteria bacterium]|nr:cysteine synthase family protein [Acidobacteriota bacterium]